MPSVFAHIIAHLPHVVSNILAVAFSNDVYNIDQAPREPVGGAARFVSAIHNAIDTSPVPTLVLFSGDAFSPAPLTPMTMGSEIPPILNATKIEAACIGNHELDNGISVLEERISETNFPWLVSNMDDRRTKQPIAGCKRLHTLTRGGVKFGFMGLAAMEWIVTLNQLELDDIQYTSYVKTAQSLSHQLRHDHGCDVVVALTHMRVGDDRVLAEAHSGIDVILGGHDHIIWKAYVNGKWCLKSGTDFKNFSTIDIYQCEDGDKHTTCFEVAEPESHAVTSAVEEDGEIASMVQEKLQLLGPSYFDELAITDVDLDGRFVSIRTRETALGNFVCDAIADELNTPIALVNSGSFRSDSSDPAGSVTRRTIDTILPFQDETLVITCDGNFLYQVLENSVSRYPSLDGRFCQVSGVWLTFDPRKASGTRIEKASVRCRNTDGSVSMLEEAQTYRLAIKTYMFNGKDGFPRGDVNDILRKAEDALPCMVLSHLRQLPRSDEDSVPTIRPREDRRIVCLHEDDSLTRDYNNY